MGTPKIGDMVLYTNLGDAEGRYLPEQHPAIVTAAGDSLSVNLCIFYATGLFYMFAVPYSEEFKSGYWSDKQ